MDFGQIGTEQAQMMAGGGFAAGARMYWRPAGKIARNLLAAGLCVGGAMLFGGDVHAFIGLSAYACGAIAGLGWVYCLLRTNSI
jgi:hypothetical protein